MPSSCHLQLLEERLEELPYGGVGVLPLAIVVFRICARTVALGWRALRLVVDPIIGAHDGGGIVLPHCDIPGLVIRRRVARLRCAAAGGSSSQALCRIARIDRRTGTTVGISWDGLWCWWRRRSLGWWRRRRGPQQTRISVAELRDVSAGLRCRWRDVRCRHWGRSLGAGRLVGRLYVDHGGDRDVLLHKVALLPWYRKSTSVLMSRNGLDLVL